MYQVVLVDYDKDPKLLALVDAAAEAIASVSHRDDGQRVGIQVHINSCQSSGHILQLHACILPACCQMWN